MKIKNLRLYLLLIYLSTMSTLGFIGCARTLPYERELLADPIMQLDPDPEENTMRQHLLNSREGSIGGFGGGGGGCGCN
ncbi:MAG: DUF4266 domain-containing protein [Nitrospiria bacterium]